MSVLTLQHEVASLEVTANKQETVFTPYLIPDASSLCTGLHIVKKLLATEKFIFVIAKSGRTVKAINLCMLCAKSLCQTVLTACLGHFFAQICLHII